jgi:hypothetical protein
MFIAQVALHNFLVTGRNDIMPNWVQLVSARLSQLLRRNSVIDAARDRDLNLFGPLLIDRGYGLLYDVARNITWLQDANYAKSVGRSPDGQMNWHAARAWVAGLSYRGITGWRLPDARGADGSGPREGENHAEGEIGHLFLVAAKRMSPPDLKLRNFESGSIYWYRNEASAEGAFAFKMLGMKQGRLTKDPWGGDMPIPLADEVLVWPVHDGDIGAGIFVRLLRRLTTALVRRTG